MRQVTNHFKQRLKERFNLNIKELENLLINNTIEHYQNGQWIPHYHLEYTFRKYPYSKLLCIENLNMCLVSDSNNSLITIYKIYD